MKQTHTHTHTQTYRQTDTHTHTHTHTQQVFLIAIVIILFVLYNNIFVYKFVSLYVKNLKGFLRYSILISFYLHKLIMHNLTDLYPFNRFTGETKVWHVDLINNIINPLHFSLAARDLLYAFSHKQDSTYLGLWYTSCVTMDGKTISEWAHWDCSILRHSHFYQLSQVPPPGAAISMGWRIWKITESNPSTAQYVPVLLIPFP